MMTECAWLDCLEVKFSLQVSGQSPTTSPSARLEMLLVAGSGPLGAGVSARLAPMVPSLPSVQRQPPHGNHLSTLLSELRLVTRVT